MGSDVQTPCWSSQTLATHMSQELSVRFSRAVTAAKTLPASTTNAHKLRLYGLYKQATVGPPLGTAPSSFDVVASSKWKAWGAVRDLSKAQAMHAYCEVVDVSAPASHPPAVSEPPEQDTSTAAGDPLEAAFLLLSSSLADSIEKGSNDQQPPARSLAEAPGVVRLSEPDWTSLYGLKRCAESGPCRTPPLCCAMDPRKRRQRVAWVAAGGVSQREAMASFVRVARAILSALSQNQNVEARPESCAFGTASNLPLLPIAPAFILRLRRLLICC